MTPSRSQTDIKITTPDPLVKLANGQSYRIRVIRDNRSGHSLHAIAAMRCENRDEIHWLSAGMPCPAATARLMRNGFALPDSPANPLISSVVSELFRNGCAVGTNS